MKKVLPLILICILFTFLIGCSVSQKSQTIDSTNSNELEETDVITSYEQLNNKKIGITTSSDLYAQLLVEEKNITPQFEYFNSNTDMFKALSIGKIDGIISDDITISIIKYQFENFEFLPAYSKMNWSFTVNLNRSDLLEEMNEVIQRLHEDGTIARIEEKWSQEGGRIAESEVVTFTGEKGVLKAGVGGDFPGYCFLREGEFVGADIDIVNIILSELGYTPEYIVFETDALELALKSGKIDICATDQAYTKERGEETLFLAPIFTANLCVVVNNPSIATQGSVTEATSFFDNLKSSFNKTFIVEGRYKLMLSGLWTTVVISMLSMLFGTIFGTFICGLYRSKYKVLQVIARVYIRLIQGTPIIVMLMILYYIIFGKVNASAIIIAVLGFSLNFAAYTAEMFRTGIDATDKGQIEAAQASGFSKMQTFIYITLPQAARHIIPVYRGEFVGMVKMTSVVGYIAIQDLTKVSDIIRSRTYEAFFPLIATALIYFGITYIFILLLNLIEKNIDPKSRKRRVKGVAVND